MLAPQLAQVSFITEISPILRTNLHNLHLSPNSSLFSAVTYRTFVDFGVHFRPPPVKLHILVTGRCVPVVDAVVMCDLLGMSEG